MIRKGNYKKTCVVGLTVCMMFSLLSGCSRNQDTTQETLWVLTEISKTDGMNNQAEQIAKAFEEEHEGVTVKLEILPTDEEEREIYLKQLRTQIMAGEGPDVYLLPTGNTVKTDLPGQTSQRRVELEYEIEPLFSDVTQAMYNGVFADVSRYYDADVELNTEGLNTEVMDAGVVDGCRYVLPIRYDMPTLFVDLSSSESAGISQILIHEGIGALARNIIDQEDTMMSIGLQMPSDTSLLPTLFDYEKGELLITEQEIADYMRLYQAWYALSATSDYLEQCEETYYDRLMESLPGMTMEELRDVIGVEFVHESLLSHLICIDGMNWSEMGFVLYSGSLQNALEQEAISWVIEKDLESYPLRAVDGSVVAEVTYYGAVGAGTANLELAYDFLREFLTEGYQWDILRPQTDRSKDTAFDWAREIQNNGLVEESWPVRAKNAAFYLWKNWRYQLYYDYNDFYPESLARFKRFRNGDLMASMEDMAVLNYEIDEVRFPFTQDYEETLEYALALLNDEDGTPTDVDVDALAKEVYLNLWWHLAEG